METVLVTGVAGNLGRRLLPQLANFRVIGVDLTEPGGDSSIEFHRMDVGREDSCPEMVALLRESKASAVVHLAFIIDPLRSGVLDVKRMWQINVAGTARVMEAITEAHRRGASVRKLIFPSSVSAYGPDLPEKVDENYPLGGHTLPYAIHKREADQVVQARAAAIHPCHAYILRPHIFVGASMQNYLVGALRGTPTGQGRAAAWLRQRGKRLPMLLPAGQIYRQKKYQFVHVDDMARLIAHLLRAPDQGPGVTVMNVAARGEPITIARCAEIAGAKIVALPTRAFCRLVVRAMWDWGVSAFPPEAFPYLAGSYTMNTARLRQFLRSDYERVMQYTVEQALADSFQGSPAQAAATQTAQSSKLA
jgi:nucleoside-diphosphate-sugar epimerase